jgi:cytoskeletal protein CcmA (bactofilin family)
MVMRLRRREEGPKGGEAGGVPAGGTIIGEGCYFSGECRVKGVLQIAGELEGSVRAENGSVNVLQGGRLTGTIVAETVCIDGAVEGEITAGHLAILAHGQVNGTISTPGLVIAEGGQFSGHSQRAEGATAGWPADTAHDGEDAAALPDA